MASSSKISNPSTLRVFYEENRRFILDPTLPSLEKRMAEADIFISPSRYELPLATSWYHIHNCPSELIAWPNPSHSYNQWLDRVVTEKG